MWVAHAGRAWWVRVFYLFDGSGDGDGDDGGAPAGMWACGNHGVGKVISNGIGRAWDSDGRDRGFGFRSAAVRYL